MADRPWQDITARLDTLAFYGSEGIELKGNGPWKALCPFHSDTHVSMSVSVTGQFKCHACGEKGSVFDFYAKRHGVEFRQSMLAVARYAPGFDVASLDRPKPTPTTPSFQSSDVDHWHRALMTNEEVMKYLENRGLTRQTMSDYKLGWTGNRVAIPIRDAEGKIINAKLYKIGGDAGTKMVWAAKGTSAPLFIPHALMDDAAGVLLVEGEFDCIIMRQHGFNAQTGTAGANTWKKEWTDAFRGKVVYILFDRDPAGREGAVRVAAALHSVGCEVHIASWPDGLHDGFDCTDWFARVGGSDDELRALLDRAVPYISPALVESNGHTRAVTAVERLPLKRLSDVEREEVEWLWHPYLPKGKLSLLVGNPGVGKSFLTAALASAVSSGWLLPGNPEKTREGNVIMLAAEDGLADTIRPRLEDMGASGLDHIMVLPPEESFSLTKDLERLSREIELHSPALVVIDPLTAYLGSATDMYRDNEVRAALGPLTQTAAEHGTSIVGVMHLTKGARDMVLHKVLGSVGFTGLARSVIAVAPDPEDPHRKIVAPLKSNLARMGESRAFSIEEGRFMWLVGEVNIDLETLFAPQIAGAGKPDTQLQQAIAFIKDALSSGEPVSSAALMQQGKKEGFPERVMKRAKTNIPALRSVKVDDVWMWQMPKGESEPERVTPVSAGNWYSDE